MTAGKQRSRLCVCLVMTAVTTGSAKMDAQTSFSARYPLTSAKNSFFRFRGGSQQPYRKEQPPPPPPRPPQAHGFERREKDDEHGLPRPTQPQRPPLPRQQQSPSVEHPSPKHPIPKPPPHHPNENQQRRGGSFSLVSSELRPPPPPRIALQSADRDASSTGWRPPPPKQRNGAVNPLSDRPQLPDRSEANMDTNPMSGIGIAPIDEGSSTTVKQQTTIADNHSVHKTTGAGAYGARNSLGDEQSSKTFNADFQWNGIERKRTSENDIFIIATPKAHQELDRISVKTGLSGKPARKAPGLQFIQMREQLILEKLLASQESLQNQIMAIAELLQEMLAGQQEVRSNFLVVHVPRELARIPPRIIRRRVEKVRKVPRKTILSDLDNLDRDLSDGEFDQLVHGLHQPSEVDEIYHEYEYDEEYPWQTSPVTPNAEEVDAFLHEHSDSDSWQSAVEELNDGEDVGSDMYYDEYYDEEILEASSMWREAVGSDEAVGELVEDDSISEHDESTAQAAPEVFPAFDVDKRNSGDDGMSDEPPNQSSGAPMDTSSVRSNFILAREDVTGLRQPVPPPPPRRPRSSSSKMESSNRVDTSRRRQSEKLSSQLVNGRLGTGPPPPPRPPPLPIRRRASAGGDEIYSDEGEALDTDEIRLLRAASVDELEDPLWSNGENVEYDDEEEDSIDEEDLKILQRSRWEDLRILHRSRWVPFANVKRVRVDSEDDFVIDDVILDLEMDEDMATDDFTDMDEIEPASPQPPLAALQEESFSDDLDDMDLGESAVSEVVAYTGSTFESRLPQAYSSGLVRRPPPPPPPRRPTPVDHNIANVSGSFLQPPRGHHTLRSQDSNTNSDDWTQPRPYVGHARQILQNHVQPRSKTAISHPPPLSHGTHRYNIVGEQGHPYGRRDQYYNEQ